VPSYITPLPQDGLLAFKIAVSIFSSLAIFKVSSAPLINSAVTSSLISVPKTLKV